MRRRRIGTLPVRQEHWEPHEQVVVKSLTMPEINYINDVANGLSGTSTQYTLLFGIASWTLTDEQGRGLPWPDISRPDSLDFDPNAIQTRLKSLAQVAPEDLLYIKGKIAEINAPNSKEELEAFLATAASTAGANQSAQTASTSPLLESAT